jgi:hypothetical protein
MDFIGVDAYFPVSDQKNSRSSAHKSRLGKVEKQLVRFRKHDKNLFAEYGYVSADYAGREPWKSLTN